jgi:hypothetical protein
MSPSLTVFTGTDISEASISSNFRVSDGGSMLFRSVDTYKPVYTIHITEDNKVHITAMGISNLTLQNIQKSI